MKIGCVIEGDTDHAFLDGIKSRWCPDAEMVILGYRGPSVRHRDYPRIVADARFKGLDIVVFLTDANNRNWNAVVTEEREQLQQSGGEDFLLGVADRNIECWLCADPDYIANRFECNVAELRSQDDPKRYFQRLLGITREDKKRDEIVALVKDVASLKIWLNNSPSLMNFYDEAKRISSLRGCQIPDELAGSRRRQR